MISGSLHGLTIDGLADYLVVAYDLPVTSPAVVVPRAWPRALEATPSEQYIKKISYKIELENYLIRNHLVELKRLEISLILDFHIFAEIYIRLA